jgi:predicted metalloprotease
MDLEREQESRNIEDRRGHRVSRGVAGGGIGTIIIILLALFFGFDPRMLLQGNVQETNFPQAPQSQQSGINDEMREFVARVLGSTERTWDQIFQAWPDLPKTDFGTFLRRRRVGLWIWPGGGGPVLLRRRSKSLYRSCFLPGIAPALSGAG